MLGRSKDSASGRYPSREGPKVPVEVFSGETNASVVRMPGRNYPAYVLQSDSLIALLRYAETAYDGAIRLGEKEQIIATGNVVARVREMMDIYSAVMAGFVSQDE